MELFGAFESLKAASEILKTLYKAKLDADTKDKLDELKQLVINANESAINYQKKMFEVLKLADEQKKIMAELIQWGKDKELYKLFQPENLGSVVYGVKEASTGGMPAHYLCTNCYQDNRKSILNNQTSKEGWTVFACPKCNTVIPTGFRGRVLPKFVPD